jgi:hypothetical protein
LVGVSFSSLCVVRQCPFDAGEDGGVFGMLSAQVEQVEAGDATPIMGLVERVGIGAWLLWLAVVGIVLLRTGNGSERSDTAQR